jgi:hypothetical protein
VIVLELHHRGVVAAEVLVELEGHQPYLGTPRKVNAASDIAIAGTLRTAFGLLAKSSRPGSPAFKGKETSWCPNAQPIMYWSGSDRTRASLGLGWVGGDG